MNILLGITGSIAAYKAPYLVRLLKEKGTDVRVVMTSSAHAFVTKLTLQTLSEHEVYDDLLDPVAEHTMGHIRLARWADHIVIAPASAHVIAKLRMGFADDLLSTLCLATTAPIIVVPAMNQQMWLNTATQEHVAHLKQRGITFLGPDVGIQACGEDGPGRMLEPEAIVDYVTTDLFLKGKRVLITAGPTQEAIDPVRFISNRSSGKMGYALAQEASRAGAIVTLVSGPVSLPPPSGINLIKVVTAQAMAQAVQEHIPYQDIFISAAAVADYSIAEPSQQKIKKSSSSFSLALTPTVDILASVCRLKSKPFVVGFAAETEHIVEYAEKKRQQKGVDLMVVNDVSRIDIGFDCDDNEVILLSSTGAIVLDKAPKPVIAKAILQQVSLS